MIGHTCQSSIQYESFSPSIDDDDEGIAGDEEAGEAAAVAGGAKVQKKEEEEVDDADVELHCRVEQQKETVDGLKDEVCGKIVEKGHAGLCR